MRKFLVISFLLSFTIGGYAQETEIRAIRGVLAQQQEAWNQGKLENFMQGYWKSDSLKFIGSAGIQYGWQATLDNYKKSYPSKERMGRLQFEILSIDLLSSESAFVIGKWSLERKKDNPKGHFTLLWKKMDGKWLIVADHSS